MQPYFEIWSQQYIAVNSNFAIAARTMRCAMRKKCLQPQFPCDFYFHKSQKKAFVKNQKIWKNPQLFGGHKMKMSVHKQGSIKLGVVPLWTKAKNRNFRPACWKISRDISSDFLDVFSKICRISTHSDFCADFSHACMMLLCK